MASSSDDKLKVGDVVRLKSGGPRMTVDNFGEQSIDQTQRGLVHCQWFEGKKLMRSAFAASALAVATDGGAVAGGARSRDDEDLF